MCRTQPVQNVRTYLPPLPGTLTHTHTPLQHINDDAHVRVQYHPYKSAAAVDALPVVCMAPVTRGRRRATVRRRQPVRAERLFSEVEWCTRGALGGLSGRSGRPSRSARGAVGEHSGGTRSAFGELPPECPRDPPECLPSASRVPRAPGRGTNEYDLQPNFRFPNPRGPDPESAQRIPLKEFVVHWRWSRGDGLGWASWAS